MNYLLIKDVISLVETFENENTANAFSDDISGFKSWICKNLNKTSAAPAWEGKEEGRSPESVINTLIVHMNRYAKTYSKSAIHNSAFSTQEDFIYLINLKVFGAMSKMELIKKNIHEKPAGIQIINRLIGQKWVRQTNSKTDKRSKIIEITPAGLKALEKQMAKIRMATKIVTGDLSEDEKMELIRLLQKLDKFHKPIYDQQFDTSDLLHKASKKMTNRLEKK